MSYLLEHGDLLCLTVREVSVQHDAFEGPVTTLHRQGGGQYQVRKYRGKLALFTRSSLDPLVQFREPAHTVRPPYKELLEGYGVRFLPKTPHHASD